MLLPEYYADQELRCPACRAKHKERPDPLVCRRCECDLQPVVDVRDEHDRLLDACLTMRKSKQHVDALRLAERIFEMRRDDASHRLLAVCHAACKEWDNAYRHASLATETITA